MKEGKILSKNDIEKRILNTAGNEVKLLGKQRGRIGSSGISRTSSWRKLAHRAFIENSQTNSQSNSPVKTEKMIVKDPCVVNLNEESNKKLTNEKYKRQLHRRSVSTNPKLHKQHPKRILPAIYQFKAPY